MGQLFGGAIEGKQQGALRDMKDRDPLKWVGLHLCGRVTLPEPHPSSASHMDTSENDPWELCGSRSQAV
ncbi:hypothetical protein CesoFtcFv8_018507 [Champsocephalus esox]|uniref:Uncharacterized protein n=1 Tax=Champsocephalus esox TaxID=159716 RepID=A0AAN8BHN2_9TELE|nr:hypothetical protein CesoFtcFv8_018507 [Champsocephalus esox]